MSRPSAVADVGQLEELLSTPGPELVAEAARWEDGLLVLGAGGKMGPTLCRMAARALAAAGRSQRVVAVSRFSDPQARAALEAAGVQTISCDLLDPQAVASLPDCRHIVFMAGRKFGSTGAEAATWATNAYLPGLLAARFPHARWVVFSSGNVYPLVPVLSGGCTEADPPAPVGEYAQSVLGRERIFEHFSRTLGTPVTLIRLNYAVELRYGVLVDVAQAVAAGEEVDVTMGHVNVLWQRDANEYALRAFSLCQSPPAILNVTGPETVSVRWVAEELGRRLGRAPRIVGQEAPTALLNNAARCFRLFGYPRTTLGEMLDLVADWVGRGGVTHGKPTHFQTRDGRF